MIGQISRFRVAWDSFLGILIVGSCLFIPYQTVFLRGGTEVGVLVLYLVDLIFYVDIVLNFFTTYRERGEEIRERKNTAARPISSGQVRSKRFFGFACFGDPFRSAGRPHPTLSASFGQTLTQSRHFMHPLSTTMRKSRTSS